MQTSRRLSSGFTLLEVLVSIAVSGVLTAVALPSLGEQVERQRMRGIGESLRNDLQVARAQALTQHRSVRVAFIQTDTGSCYVVYQGPANACTCDSDGAIQCKPGASALSAQGVADKLGVQLSANVSTMVFDGRTGTVAPTGTMTLKTRQGLEMKHIVSITGRIRSCGDVGHQTPACRG
ncbi:MAG: GspH/FimT family pseudopilin [Burkholderiales bacterium]|nr:GspH/FimT family pseudopilin [Burkholderiales bacterium]